MDKAEYSAMAEVENRHWWFQARLRIVRRLLQKYAPKGGTGLDCSCGTGLTLRQLNRWVQHGSDISDAALSFIDLPNLSKADLCSLPFADDSMDVVTSLDTLEHVDDDRLAVTEITRVLKPNGVTILTVPAHPWMFSPHDRALHHVRRYRKTEFRELVVGTGLKVLRFSYFNTGLSPLVALIRLLRPDNGTAVSDTQGVPFSPLNNLLKLIFAAEKLWLPYAPLPWGVSLICVARKPR